MRARQRIEEIRRLLERKKSGVSLVDAADDDDSGDEIDDATAAAICNAVQLSPVRRRFPTFLHSSLILTQTPPCCALQPAGARLRLDADEAKLFGLDTELQFLEHQVKTRQLIIERELATSLDRVFVKVRFLFSLRPIPPALPSLFHVLTPLCKRTGARPRSRADGRG